jgi:hypothetical protein
MLRATSFLLATLLATPLAAAQQTQPSGVVTSGGTSAYTSGPIADEEAVAVSVTSTVTTASNPLLTLIDETGAEQDCILPCTARTRVGLLAIEGERLNVEVDLAVAGLTYDVTVTPGPTGEDLALVSLLMVTGGAAFGLGVWGLVESRDEDITTLAAIGAVYGGIAFGITLPWLIVLLVQIDGTASVTNYRRGLAGLELGPGGVGVRF